MMNKDKFVTILKRMEEQEKIDLDFAEAVSKAFDCFAVSYNNGRLSRIVVDLLNDIFDLSKTAEYGSDIEYFMYELDYGKKWKTGMITDKDGNDIDFSTAEKLYDYLTKPSAIKQEIVVGC